MSYILEFYNRNRAKEKNVIAGIFACGVDRRDTSTVDCSVRSGAKIMHVNKICIINNFDANNRKNEFKRIRCRLHHMNQRVDCVAGRDLNAKRSVGLSGDYKQTSQPVDNLIVLNDNGNINPQATSGHIELNHISCEHAPTFKYS